jgi:hypothetical protein
MPMKILKRYMIEEEVDLPEEYESRSRELAKTYLEDGDSLEKEEIREAFMKLYPNIIDDLSNEMGKEDADGKVLVDWVLEV